MKNCTQNNHFAHELKGGELTGKQVNKRKNQSNSNKEEVKKVATYWERVMLGFAGGILVLGGIWIFSSFQGTPRILSVIAILAGIAAVFYGRHA